jgi:hypothetical protein
MPCRRHSVQIHRRVPVPVPESGLGLVGGGAAQAPGDLRGDGSPRDLLGGESVVCLRAWFWVQIAICFVHMLIMSLYTFFRFRAVPHRLLTKNDSFS